MKRDLREKKEYFDEKKYDGLYGNVLPPLLPNEQIPLMKSSKTTRLFMLNLGNVLDPIAQIKIRVT